MLSKRYPYCANEPSVFIIMTDWSVELSFLQSAQITVPFSSLLPNPKSLPYANALPCASIATVPEQYETADFIPCASSSGVDERTSAVLKLFLAV